MTEKTPQNLARLLFTLPKPASMPDNSKASKSQVEMTIKTAMELDSK